MRNMEWMERASKLLRLYGRNFPGKRSFAWLVWTPLCLDNNSERSIRSSSINTRRIGKFHSIGGYMSCTERFALCICKYFRRANLMKVNLFKLLPRPEKGMGIINSIWCWKLDITFTRGKHVYFLNRIFIYKSLGTLIVLEYLLHLFLDNINNKFKGQVRFVDSLKQQVMEYNWISELQQIQSIAKTSIKATL